MRILYKFKLHLQLSVKIVIDGVFIYFWAIVIYNLHVRALPELGLDGIPGFVINGVAIAFDICTMLSVLIIAFKDLLDEYHEHFGKNKRKVKYES